MCRMRLILAVAIMAGAVGLTGVCTLIPTPAAQLPASPGSEKVVAAAAEGPEAAIKQITAEYVMAFNAADAAAAAALWTAEGEYVGPDGEIFRGRTSIEKSLADFFKTHPKATIEVQVTSVRLIGRQTAMVEGVVKFKTPKQREAGETRYSALNVLEEGRWRTASVHEWTPDPGLAEATKHLNWLVGEWSATGDRGTLAISYAWDANKTFLYGKYSITKDGKPVSSGTQVIGLNPSGGLRSWMFDDNGAANTAVWEHDGDRWVERANSTLPDGREIEAVNVLILLGSDTFSWQTTERTVDGIPLAPSPPLKVSRVKHK